MTISSINAITDFEVYVIMTMRLRIKMSHKEAQLDEKLAQHGLSLGDAESGYREIATALSDEASRFTNLKNLLGIVDADLSALEYSSVLWPGFNFHAIADDGGLLESARYWQAVRNSANFDSPAEFRIWSMDVTEFTEQFGPMRKGRQWPMFDEILPAYEEYEFLWNGESYGAGFSWGLFMFSAKSWPED